MNVTGESFDYGPYRFLPECDPGFVAAYFDASGLYAFGRQPAAVLWNLERLAEALLPLSTEAALRAALGEFAARLPHARSRKGCSRASAWRRAMPHRDDELARAVFGFLEESRVGFDQFFFDWYGGAASAARAAASPAATATAAPASSALRGLLEAYSSDRVRAARAAVLPARHAVHAADRRDRGALGRRSPSATTGRRSTPSSAPSPSSAPPWGGAGNGERPPRVPAGAAGAYGSRRALRPAQPALRLAARRLHVDPGSVVAAIGRAAAADPRPRRHRRVAHHARARLVSGVARVGDMAFAPEALPADAVTAVLCAGLTDRGAGRVRLALIYAEPDTGGTS